MMTPIERREKAMSLFREGYNCSQAVFAAFADIMDIDLDTSLRIVSSFGGGMGRLREVCGSVSGMFAVLGYLYGYSDPSVKGAKTAHYKRIQELAATFRERNGSIVCRELLGPALAGSGYVPEERTEAYYKKRPCESLIGDAAEILQMYIDEMEKEDATGTFLKKSPLNPQKL